jgi:hypothetical protein
MPQTSHFESAQSWCGRLTGSFQPDEQIVSPAHKELSWGIHLLFMRGARSLDSSKFSLLVGLLFSTLEVCDMKARSLLLVPLLGVVAVLSACAGPMPKADPTEAWIGLQEEPSGVLMAEDVDGKRLNDGRYFDVKPGAHKLDVNLIVEGAGNNDDQMNCEAGIQFSQFKAGEHYKLVESSLGDEYSVKLEDSQGHQIGHSKDFTCMPG